MKRKCGGKKGLKPGDTVVLLRDDEGYDTFIPKGTKGELADWIAGTHWLVYFKGEDVQECPCFMEDDDEGGDEGGDEDLGPLTSLGLLLDETEFEKVEQPPGKNGADRG